MHGANGLSLLDNAESDRRVFGVSEGVDQVIAFLRAH
jgi:hypothetical protein